LTPIPVVMVMEASLEAALREVPEKLHKEEKTEKND
jgi:hypothetical protein